MVRQPTASQEYTTGKKTYNMMRQPIAIQEYTEGKKKYKVSYLPGTFLWHISHVYTGHNDGRQNSSPVDTYTQHIRWPLTP